jgi:hypothetical protein
MAEATITYFGKPARVACDENCAKAWGIQVRPAVQLSDNEDDWEWLADQELPTAPKDPGTREGYDAKPPSARQFPNRWCVRQCERCRITPPDQPDAPIELRDFSKRIQNIPGKHKVD